MNRNRVYKRIASLAFTLVVASYCTPAKAQFTANSMDELRGFGLAANNFSINLSPTGGDPHPVTGVVTPGHYWLDGDHITSPTSTHPRFMVLGGTGNTYDLSGTTINVDTRKLDGYGRGLGHDSGVDVFRIEGSNNTVQGLTLIGQDIALDTDPNAQRYADWSTVYVELSGVSNTVDGAHVVARGSRTDTYGLSDAFGKGSSGGIQPFIAHRKASNFRVGEATNAVVNDIHLETYSFGHNFFVQGSNNTTLTNSTIKAELFPSQLVVDRPEYQEAGHTWWGEPIPDDIMLAGSEGGVRVYGGSSGLTVDNVVVDGARTGFATVHDGGQVNLNNVFAYNTTSGFDVGDNTTITNSGGNIVNGPLLVFYGSGNNTDIDLELTEGTPIGTNWSAAYFNGNADISITSDLAAGDLPEESYIRLGQSYFENWRDQDYNTADPEAENPTAFNNQTFINDTNQKVFIGENAVGNVGRSLGGVISNGKENRYDGVTFVPTGSRLELTHIKGLGNSGTETYSGPVTAQTLEDNASVVESGATLELASGIRITDEKLTISGDGVDGLGALYAGGSGSRFGTSSNSDDSTIFLDGNASIGVASDLIVGRVQGIGNLTKLGVGNLSLEKSNTFTGELIVAEGGVSVRSGGVNHGLTVNSGTVLGSIGNLGINSSDDQAVIDGTLDLNMRTNQTVQTSRVGSLSGSGQVTSTNQASGSAAVLEIVGNDTDGVFTGGVEGEISVVKSGDNNQTLGGGLMTHTGTTTVTGGGLYIDGIHTGGGDYTVDGATLGGTGLLQSNVAASNGATLAPGDASGASKGNLNIGGNYSQSDDSTVAFDIENDSSHDALTVWGLASLDGTLDLTSTDPSQYSLGDTITLINSLASVSGQFNSINGISVGTVDGLNAGLAVQYNSQSVNARVSIIGDANLDDQVNVLGDAFLLVGNLGINAGATWLDGDFTGDGAVNVLGDAFLLVGNIGSSISGSSATTSAVPEPNSAAVLMVFGLTAFARRRRLGNRI